MGEGGNVWGHGGGLEGGVGADGRCRGGKLCCGRHEWLRCRERRGLLLLHLPLWLMGLVIEGVVVI